MIKHRALRRFTSATPDRSLPEARAEFLVVGKRGLVVVTFWDKTEAKDASRRAIASLSLESGVDFIPLDARRLTAIDHDRLEQALGRLGNAEPNPLEVDSSSSPRFLKPALVGRAGRRIEPAAGPLDQPGLGPLLAVLLVVFPAAATIFGATCSYQLPASLAVLAAAGAASGQGAIRLTLIFLGYLLLTTLVYVRLTASAQARHPLNQLVIPPRPFMQRPTIAAVWREASGVVRQFLLQALPVFVLICGVAAVAAESGLLDRAAAGLGPVMRLFDLPAEAAVAVVMASVRKDGIFLLAGDAAEGGLTAAQAVTAVYLAGVLLPCLVTAMAIARETGRLRAFKLLARQFVFAVLFSVILAWGGRWVL